MSRTMKTRRLRRSSDGQRSSQAGGWKTCWTPWITAGRSGLSATLTMPFRRRRSPPQCSARTSSSSVSVTARIGCSRRIGEAGNLRVVGDAARACARARGRARAHRGRARPHGRGPVARGSQPHVEQPLRIDVAEGGRQHRGRRIECGEAVDQAVRARRRSRSVLVRIRRSATATCFTDSGCARERGEAVDGIDGRHHAGEREALREAGIAHQRVQDRRRIGKPAGLDDDALERRHRARVAPPQDVLQRQHEVAAHRAAQAARSAARRSSPRWSRSGRGRARPRRTR